MHFSGFDRLAIQRGVHAGFYVNRCVSGMEFEAACAGRRRSGKNDVIQRTRAESVVAIVQPEKPADGEPATIGFQLRLIRLPPFFDGLAIGWGVRASRERE